MYQGTTSVVPSSLQAAFNMQKSNWASAPADVRRCIRSMLTLKSSASFLWTKTVRSTVSTAILISSVRQHRLSQKLRTICYLPIASCSYVCAIFADTSMPSAPSISKSTAGPCWAERSDSMVCSQSVLPSPGHRCVSRSRSLSCT